MLLASLGPPYGYGCSNVVATSMTQLSDTSNPPAKRHWRALVGVCLFVVVARVYLSLVLGGNARYRWELPKNLGETLFLCVAVLLASLAGALVGRRSLGKPTAVALAAAAGGLVSAAYNGLIGAAIGLCIGMLVASSLARRGTVWFLQSALAALCGAATGFAALWFDPDLSDGPCPATCTVLSLGFVGLLVVLRWRAKRWPESSRWLRWASGASLLLFMMAGVWTSLSLDMLRRVDHLAKPGRHNREMVIRPLSDQWLWPGPIAVEFIRVGVDATDDDLRALRGWQELINLDIESNKISDLGLAHLSQLTSLWSLSLASPRITDEGLRHLEGLGSLQVLDLKHAHVSGKGIDRLTQFMSLNVLSLPDSSFDDDDLASCAPSLLGVYTLDLSGTRVTDGGIPYLAPMTRLRYLRVAHTSITGKGFRALAGLPSLKSVDLSGTSITDDDIPAPEQWGAIRDLRLGDTSITDRGAARLARLPIAYLGLRGTSISDAGMDALSRSAALQGLDVYETRVTEEAVNRLKTKLPNCHVWWGPVEGR